MNGPTAAPRVPAFVGVEAERVESALAEVLDEQLRDWPAPLADAVRYAALGGGKRFRPILCVAAFRAVSVDEPGPAVYRIACALELIHAYSLVHDDLPCMDDSDLRRGRPTAHRVHGVAVAAIAGAAMIALACRVLDSGAAELGLSVAERAAALRELCIAAGAAGMVGGQWLDLEAEGRDDVTLPELERVHRAKTGALLAAAPALGGRAARAGQTVVDALARYGRSLGLAFQIADDLLDVTARAADLGKPAGRDQVLGKATFPALLGIEAARRRARAEADAAVAALRGAGIESPELEALARYAVDRAK